MAIALSTPEMINKTNKRIFYLLCHFLKVTLTFALSLPLIYNYNWSLQAEVAQPTTKEEPLVCNGDVVEYFKAEKKVVGSGNIVITYKDATLTADKVTLWPEIKLARAEGNVKIMQGENILEGETITYNFEKETAQLLKARATAPPWYAVGKEAERINKEQIIVRNGYMTTCDHKRPHWKLSAKRVEVYPGKMITTYNAIAWLNPLFLPFDIPVMWIPYYCHPLDDNKPHVTLIPGKNKQWGYYLLTAWRYNLTPNQKGHVHLDYREKKDFAGGIDYIYEGIFGTATVKTYYMNEREIKLKHNYQRLIKKRWRDVWGHEKDYAWKPSTELEKGLLRIRHKWQMSPSTLINAEMHKYKDENLLKDYFFMEYEKDEHPESYLLLSNVTPYANLTLLTKKRMNRFDTTTELLPDAKIDISNLRLLKSRFFYTGTFNATHFNRVYPRHTDQSPGCITDPQHNNRYDAYSKLSYESKLGFVNVTPYAATRQTYYDREVSADNSQLRGVFYTGLDCSTKFYKTFDVHGSPIGMEINKLRHIITPTVSYAYIPPPTMQPSKIAQFDSIDSIDRNSTMSLGLENKLQTKRGREYQSVDLAMLLINTNYDFRHNPGTQFLDYTTRLELRPYDWLTATSNSVIDPHRRYHHRWLKQLDSDISFTFGKKGSLGIGHRYTEGSNNLVLQAKLDAVPNWRFSIYEDIDILGRRNGDKKKRDLKTQEYVITKDLHCWEMDIRYNVDRDSGEEIMVVFRLKAFPEIPFEFGRNYHMPKIGS